MEDKKSFVNSEQYRYESRLLHPMSQTPKNLEKADSFETEYQIDSSTGTPDKDLSTDSVGKDEFDSDISYTDMESSFVAEFSDGYSFRNLIEYLRVTNTKGNFRFRKDLISYEQIDVDHLIVNQIQIHTCELTHYEMFSTNSEIIVGVNINDIRGITRTIGKKDSVRLFKHENDPLLYIQIIGQNNRGANRQNISVVRPQQVDLVVYEIPEYHNGEKSPNCTIPSQDFAKTCTSLASVKCNYVSIFAMPRGIILEGVQEGSTFARKEQFGSCESYTSPIYPVFNSSSTSYSSKHLIVPSGPKPKLIVKTENTPILEIKVKMSLIKALAKINNLSASGTVKVYAESGNPLKLNSKIGSCGNINIYIRSLDDVSS